MLLGIALHAALSFGDLEWIVRDTRRSGVFGLFFLAIHGFRMPLFFLLSGFFTAMLWRKRGLKALLHHRVRRIVVPLALCMITIIPVMNVSVWVAIAFGSKSESQGETQQDIWTAASEGDLEAIKEHLDGGADVDALGPDNDTTPLILAAILGQSEAVDLLIRMGADVNARDKNGSTALHVAAFVGHPEAAESLIAAGADVSALNGDGTTVRDTLKADWGITQFIAGILGIELDREDVYAGREKIVSLLNDIERDGSGTPLNAGDGKPSWEDEKDRDGVGALVGWLMYALMYASVFHHLWFLWHLCWLVLAFALYAVVADRLGWRGLSDWAVVSPARFLWLVPLTMLPQWFMEGFGPDTSAGILPMPRVLGYYAIFFGFGALYYDRDDDEGRAGKWWRGTLPVALLFVLPLGLWAMEGGKNSTDELLRLMSTALKVIYAWTMTFGLMGMFRSLCSRENRKTRYVSDSSYWLYIAHLPPMILAQAWVRDWPVPALVKFVFISVLVTGVLLVMYQTLIRYTVIGTLLNGARQRPGKQTVDTTG